MRFIELSKFDIVKFDEVLGARIMSKRSDSKEADIFYANWGTVSFGDIQSDEYPTYATCVNYVRKKLKEVSDVELYVECFGKEDDDD